MFGPIVLIFPQVLARSVRAGQALADAAVGRSHRAKLGKAKLAEVLDLSRAILGLPDDYRIGIVPGSDTGAVEMALWSLLGARGVDILAWESFGEGWVTDLTKQLKLSDLRVFLGRLWQDSRSFGGRFCPRRDLHLERNDVGRACPQRRLDPRRPRRPGHHRRHVRPFSPWIFPGTKPMSSTWSWQKVLGGEGAHGMLVLSPRAVARLESHKPAWPLPKVFRLTSGGKLIEGIFKGDTINTPSLLAVEDQIDALRWAQSVGGLKGLIARTEANLKALEAWVAKSNWAAFLAQDAAVRSPTSICLTIKAPFFAQLSADDQAAAAKKIASLLEKEGVAMDIGFLPRRAARTAHLGGRHGRNVRHRRAHTLARLGFFAG